MLIAFLDVATHEPLCLDDNVFHEFVVVFGCHGLLEFFYLREYFLTPVFLGTLAFQDMNVEVGKLCV